jgi:uncharacterized protein (DUF302 family)
MGWGESVLDRRDTVMARFALIAAAAAALMLSTPASAELVRKESPYSVTETVERLATVLKERNLTVFNRIDHAAGAKQAGQDLRPTVLIIFGSPAVGTPLMQAEQTMGLSLPLKALVWQDAAGKVWLGYDAPVGMAKERGLPADNPVIARVTGALTAITDSAVKR